MSIQQAVRYHVQLLSVVRGELALQAHLFRADLRDRWEELEERWHAYQGKLRRARAAGDSEPEVLAAAHRLEEALRQDYAAFRAAAEKRGALI